MITRKDLVEALRVLHESDQITQIRTRAKRIDIHYMSGGRSDSLLVVPNPQTDSATNKTNKDRTKSKHRASEGSSATTNH